MRNLDQFGVGCSRLSITRTSTIALVVVSLRPSCSCNAVNIDAAFGSPAVDEDPVAQLRRHDMQQLLLAHARRALDDFWGPAERQEGAFFERAVAADPQDAQARYQQAVARAKLGDSAGAIADFQAALALQPQFPAAALELGIALVDSGRFQDAEPWLKQAQTDRELDAQASFLLGIAQLRLERYDEALQSFARARARDDSLALATQFYDGVIAFSQTDFTEDLKKITVPVLVMHGADDQIVPYADSAPLAAKLLKNGTLKTYKGFPHGMPTTHADVINADLLAFLKS